MLPDGPEVKSPQQLGVKWSVVPFILRETYVIKLSPIFWQSKYKTNYGTTTASYTCTGGLQGSRSVLVFVQYHTPCGVVVGTSTLYIDINEHVVKICTENAGHAYYSQ